MTISIQFFLSKGLDFVEQRSDRNGAALGRAKLNGLISEIIMTHSF